MAEITTIVNRLITRTKDGSLDWAVADGSEPSVTAALQHSASSEQNDPSDYDFGDDDAFFVDLPNSAVVLHLDSDEDVVITLLDGEYSVLAQINVGFSNLSEYKEAVEALYERARRNALGIDEGLDDLLNDLQ